MANRLLGIAILLLGLLLLFRVFMAGTFFFLILAAVLALAAGTGAIGRTGYVLAAIFLVLGLAGSALRLAVGAVAMLFRLAPVLLVLTGIYLLARAVRK